MSFRRLVFCAFFAFGIFGGHASPVATDTSEELVRTPGGLVPKSNVHAVPEGARINHTPTGVQIIGADGTIIHSATRDNARAGTRSPLAPRDLNEGYVAYSSWENLASSPISSFSTSWIVPPAPTHWDGQLLYIFEGLIPNSFDSILQPVLQYGVSPAGGGEYWAVASWFVDVPTDGSYYTTPVKVKVGQELTGVMTLLSTKGSGSSATWNWSTTFKGISGTTLSTTTTEMLNWAYEALEIYYVTEAADLPAGTMSMTNISLTTQAGPPPKIGWVPANDTSDKIYTSVVSTSASSGTVKITYPLT